MAKMTPLEKAAIEEKVGAERARLRKERTPRLEAIDEAMQAGREALDEQRRESRFTSPDLEERAKTAYKKGGSVKGWGMARGARKAKVY